MNLDDIGALSASIKSELRKVIVGQDSTVELLLCGLLTGGHVLLEGVPGIGKTLLARTFANTLSLKFGRIQFTPDLMPGDVLGTNLFDFRTSEFSLTRGPIFTDMLLADEINRTPPKTQAALLQAMQERSVTIDSTDYDLGDAFMVIATQNPIEQQGTYPLPEAQLDRFLFKHVLSYPSRDEERQIVANHGQSAVSPGNGAAAVNAVTDIAKLREARSFIREIRISDELLDYIVDVVRNTRENPSLEFGASPRSAAMLASSVRAYATMCARDYVIPDDVKFLAAPTLRHRVVLSPGTEIEGTTADQVIEQILESTDPPR